MVRNLEEIAFANQSHCIDLEPMHETYLKLECPRVPFLVESQVIRVDERDLLVRRFRGKDVLRACQRSISFSEGLCGKAGGLTARDTFLNPTFSRTS